MTFPQRHLSIRVPWHDHGWIGSVCKKPTLNSACLCLKNIGAKKQEEAEERVKGQSLEHLDEVQYPPCVMDRSTFMAPFAFVKHHSHPYTQTSPETHGHFALTPLRFPAYSAPGVPFRWMQRDMVWGKTDERWPVRGLKEDYPLEAITEGREPKLGFKTAWMQDAQNHQELLNCFWNHIRTDESDGPEASLVFFYAKQIPLTEEPARRVIVGVGRVSRLGPLTEYKYNDQKTKDSCRSLLWERMVTHSIRPGFKDGFLMPYHQALAKMEEHPEFDPAPLIAFAPADRNAEFSYATEHVTPDGALSSLLVVADALRQAQTLLTGDFSKQIEWIDEQITRLWKQRGPCPGLGAVLGAMGIPLGSFVANEIVEKTGTEKDPWPLVEKMLEAPAHHLSSELASRVDPVVGKGWKKRSDTRKCFIRLLSRFVANESYKDFVAGLQKDIGASLSARPQKANKEFFTDKVLKTEFGDVKVTPKMATQIEFYLIRKGYIDDDHRITEVYLCAKRDGTLAALPAELEPYKEQIFQLVNTVFSADQMPQIEDELKAKENPLNANFEKKEFQELWHRINHKAVYAVDFQTEELIQKCIQTLDKELKVTPLQYTVTAGEQKDEASFEQVKSGDSFQTKSNSTETLTTTASSAVKYDLIGKLCEATKLTRRTIAAILQGILAARFGQYRTNPENFIMEAARLINEQKATVIVEHLTYDTTTSTYAAPDIFTQRKEDLSKGFKATKHIYDYVFTDSSGERTFVGELDASSEVVVYAKLPRAFSIPTPVGNYNPDWAIAFQAGKVKHIYFIAETKGSMSSMDLREIEKSKIECARKFFAKITSDQVKYDVVNSYGKLMELVK